MDPLLNAIREKPLSYLPEASLQAFGHFRSGYALRSSMEARPHDWQFDRREFGEWLSARFEVQGADVLNDIRIVSSLSAVLSKRR
jgi:hypothetical protein